MNSYTYNDVSWRVFGEINGGSVVKLLNVKELHQSHVSSFLWNAMNLMNYSAKNQIIYYNITETEFGYTFQMNWTTSKVKANTINDYIKLLKTNEEPETGGTSWKESISSAIRSLLKYSSAFSFTYTDDIDKIDFQQVTLNSEIKFSSLIDTPSKSRFYKEAPQRQLSIFDVFEYEYIDREVDEKQFVVKFEYKTNMIHAVISYKDKTVKFFFSEMSGTHFHLQMFLDSIINLFNQFPDEAKYVNVFSRNSGFRYFGDLVDENFIITEHTRFCESDGPNINTMDLKVRAHKILLLLRKDPDLYYEDDWFYNMSDIEFECEHKLKSKKELEECVLLSISVSYNTFLKKVIEAVKDLKSEVGLENYKKEFRNDFPEDRLNKLEFIINKNPLF